MMMSNRTTYEDDQKQRTGDTCFSSNFTRKGNVTKNEK